MNWEVDGFNLTAVIEEMENGGWKQVCNCNYGSAEPEKHLELNKANAKLIAAAPEMLELLKWISRVTNSPEIGIMCDRMIKRATTL